MSNESGIFSLSLKALKFQVDTILANCGGDKAAQLLDLISNCSPAAQDKILNIFIKTLNSCDGLNLKALEDSFEEELFQDICAELEGQSSGTKFQVIDGGVSLQQSNVVDFQSFQTKKA